MQKGRLNQLTVGFQQKQKDAGSMDWETVLPLHEAWGHAGIFQVCTLCTPVQQICPHYTTLLYKNNIIQLKYIFDMEMG